MKKITLIVLSVLIGFTFSCGSDDEDVSIDGGVAAGLEVNINKVLLLGIINDHRQAGATCGSDNISSVSNLQWSDELAKAALDHSNDMQQNDYFDHTSQDGRKFSERATAAGFEGSPVGENIAGGYPSEEAVMQGWMDSPGHCKNIMSSRATHVGVAKSDEGAMWTMVLGKM